MLSVASAVLLGIAVGLCVAASRTRLHRRWRRDSEWARQQMLRFSPDLHDARLWVLLWYAGIVLVPIVVLFALPGVLPAAVAAACLMVAPRLLSGYLWKRRRRKIDEQLPTAISALANCIQAGFTLVQGIQRVAETSPNPVRQEFRIIANRYHHGADLQAAIEDARQRLQLPNFTLFSSAMLVNREMGGKVGRTLDRIAQSLESVDRMRCRLRAATSGGRTTIKFLAVAPVVILGIVNFMDPEGVKMVFTEPLGQIVLLVALLIASAGVYWAHTIVNAEV